MINVNYLCKKDGEINIKYIEVTNDLLPEKTILINSNKIQYIAYMDKSLEGVYDTENDTYTTIEVPVHMIDVVLHNENFQFRFETIDEAFKFMDDLKELI